MKIRWERFDFKEAFTSTFGWVGGLVAALVIVVMIVLALAVMIAALTTLSWWKSMLLMLCVVFVFKFLIRLFEQYYDVRYTGMPDNKDS